MGKLLAILIVAAGIWVILAIAIYVNENVLDLGATMTVKEFMNGGGLVCALFFAIAFYFISKIFRK